MMGIYDNIQNVAKKKGISINKMEKDLGLPRGSMYKYNKSIPNSEKIMMIAEYLGCSTEELLYGEEADGGYYHDRKTAEIAEEIYQNHELHLLFDAARDSSPEELRKFYDMILIIKRKENHED